MTRSTVVAALGLAVACTLGACSRSPTSPVVGASGTYTLRTVNGGALPATLFQSGDTTVDVTAGDVSLNQDATASYSLTLSATVSGQSTTRTQTGQGTWTLTGNTVVATWQGGGGNPFAHPGNHPPGTLSGVPLVFRR